VLYSSLMAGELNATNLFHNLQKSSKLCVVHAAVVCIVWKYGSLEIAVYISASTILTTIQCIAPSTVHIHG
jgi:hypothetical protein